MAAVAASRFFRPLNIREKCKRPSVTAMPITCRQRPRGQFHEGNQDDGDNCKAQRHEEQGWQVRETGFRNGEIQSPDQGYRQKHDKMKRRDASGHQVEARSDARASRISSSSSQRSSAALSSLLAVSSSDAMPENAFGSPS